MIWGVVVASVIIGLLCLIDQAAANALFSLAVAGNDLAWGTPIFCRLVWGQDKFRPGEFYTGWLSKPIAITAIIYLAFAITLSMFPTTGPNPSRKYFSWCSFAYQALVLRLHPTAEDMNYTIVINGTLWLGAILYYALFARKWFTGPKMTVGTDTESDQSPALEHSDENTPSETTVNVK